MSVEVDDIEDLSVSAISAAVSAMGIDPVTSTARIVGVYTEATWGIPAGPGVEGVKFVGVNLDTGQKVVAYYAGVTMGVGIAPILGASVSGGAFAFTGGLDAFSGVSVAYQVSSGVTAGVSVNVDGSGELALVGANLTSVGANVAAGYTFSVSHDGELVYFFGTVERFDTSFTGEQYDRAMHSLANSPSGRVQVSYLHPDGVTIVQTMQKRSNGTADGFEVYVVEKVLDAEGNRLSGAEAKDYIESPHLSWQFDVSGEQVSNIQAGPTCFAAGTLVDMADGSRKAIELIEPDDVVLAYDETKADGRGELVPSRVVRTFTNQAPAVLDFHGLKVTPGHATLCGDGPFAGQHRPLIDIVLDDGAIVDREGALIRASTNLPVGSEGDRLVEVACYATPDAAAFTRAHLRLGTLLLRDEGEAVRISELLGAEGYQLHEDGLVSRDREVPHPLAWIGSPPKPEDYVLKKSGLSFGQLYDEVAGVHAGNILN